jgi:hypothetical protein
MQRISDFRMSGTSQRNFRIFRELCGESSLKNVLLVTNMWSEVNREIEEAREVELATKDQFFKPVLDQGARLLRHVGTLESVHTILHHLIDSDPAALRIQQEIVDEHKPIEQTAAGSELRHSLDEQADRHREDMRTLQADMEAAMRTRDEKNRGEFQKALEKKQQDYLRIMEQTSERIAAEFVAERARLEDRIQHMEDEHHKQLQTMAGLQGEIALQEKKQKEALKQGEILVANQADDDRRAQEPEERRNARASGEESHQKHSLRNILEELEKVRIEFQRERERLAALERPLVDRLLAKVSESWFRVTSLIREAALLVYGYVIIAIAMAPPFTSFVRAAYLLAFCCFWLQVLEEDIDKAIAPGGSWTPFVRTTFLCVSGFLL